MWKERKGFIGVNTQLCVWGVLLFAGMLVLFSGACAAEEDNIFYENEYYCFSHPEKVTVQERTSLGYVEVDFVQNKKVMGGIKYYPLSTWDDFYNYDSGNDNIETLLEKQGMLQPDENLYAYMFDIGVDDRSATLWEQRADTKREHFFFFTESGPCYDLWFYCDEQSNAEKETIKESFRLEVTT